MKFALLPIHLFFYLLDNQVSISEFFSSPLNQRLFMNEVATQLRIYSMEGWYTIDSTDLVDRNGIILLEDYFEGSVLVCLEGVYPECDWKPWKFKRVEEGYWHNKDNHLLFFERYSFH